MSVRTRRRETKTQQIDRLASISLKLDIALKKHELRARYDRRTTNDTITERESQRGYVV